MAKYPHLTRRAAQGIFHFRHVVPERLRPIIGKREILKSLRTADRAQALRRYRLVAEEAERELAAAEAAVRVPRPQTSAPVIADLTLASIAQRAQQCRRKIEVERHHLDQRWREEELTFRRATVARVHADPDAFWRGDIVGLPDADGHKPYTPTSDRGRSLDEQAESAFRLRLEQELTRLRVEQLVAECGALGSALPATITQQASHPAVLKAKAASALAKTNRQVEALRHPT